MPLDEQAANTLGQALLSQLFRLPIPTIREIAGAAGLDADRIPARSEAQGGMGSRAEVTPVVQQLFGALPLDRKNRALPILAEEIAGRYLQRRETDRAERVSSSYSNMAIVLWMVGSFQTASMSANADFCQPPPSKNL